MVELLTRGLLVGLYALGAGWLGYASFPTAVVIGLFTLAYAYGAHVWEQKGKTNSGSAGIFACADAVSIAAMLGAAHHLSDLGFLVLAPLAYAAASRGALPSAMAPIAASALFASHQIFAETEPTALFYAQAIGVLGVGMLLNHRRIVVTVTRDVVGPIEPLSTTEPDGVLELREGYRQLKTMYRDLEVSSRRDRLVARLLETRFPNGDRFHARLAKALKDVLDVDGLCLYGVATLDDRLVVRAAIGHTPESAATEALPIDLGQAPGRIKHQLEKTLLATPHTDSISNVLLISRGKSVGFLTLRAEAAERAEEARAAAEELAPIIAELLVEEDRKQAEANRLRQSELLYETAIVTQGAETPAHLSDRVIRELANMIDVDFLAAYALDGEELILTASRGDRMPLFEALSFGYGPGVEGWLRSGAPEVFAFDAKDDPRALASEIAKRRIGSFAILPLDFGDGPVGALIAVAKRTGAIDRREQDTLRVVAAELGRAMGVVQGAFGEGEGLVSAPEFAALIREEGCLVIIEPLRREALVEKVGAASVEYAMRRYAKRLRAKLPPGSGACFRAQGDLVAYLRGATPEDAQAWANEMAAAASLNAIESPDGRTRIPLAVRAHVSQIESPTAIMKV